MKFTEFVTYPKLYVLVKIMFTNGLNCLKKVEKVFKMKTGLAKKPKMVDFVNIHILADRRVTSEDISEQMGFSVGTEDKIVYNGLAFLKSIVIGFQKH